MHHFQEYTAVSILERQRRVMVASSATALFFFSLLYLFLSLPSVFLVHVYVSLHPLLSCVLEFFGSSYDMDIE